MQNTKNISPTLQFYYQRLLLIISFVLSFGYSQACTLACSGDINVSLNSSGYAIVTPQALLAGNATNCYNLEVIIYNPNNQNIGNTVDCQYVGQKLPAGVRDLITGNTCWGSVYVNDYLPPSLTCDDIFIYCHEPYHPDSIGYPIVQDNCTSLNNNNLTYFDSFIDLDCYSTVNNTSVTAKIERLWTVSDATGLVSTCVQNIYLKNILFSDIDFPENRDDFEQTKLACADDPDNFVLSGQPTAFGRPLGNNMDFCELVVNYSDLVVPTCGGASKILREWEIINWCSGNNTTDIQIIDLADQVNPTITCMNNPMIDTDPYECTATVMLPNATATDLCSDFTIVPTWQFGTGFGPFNAVPLGTYTVTYTATDDCGNQASCTSNVSIGEDEQPVAICKDLLNVSLQADGMVRLYATHFDNGSYDNCAVDRVEISKDNLNFANFLTFDCSDIPNNPIPVIMRVVDIHGFSNTCNTMVYLMDNIPPTINCPSDITIQCDQDYNDLSLTGNAMSSDNCMLDTLYYTDNITINSNCGSGILYRSWVSKDIGGLTRNCTQVITLANDYALNVQFPIDQTIDFCQGTLDPSDTGEPIINNENCRTLGVTHTDQVFSSTGTCSLIQRNWVVIDWCTYQANSGNNAGRYEHSQWIQIEDTQAPVLQCLTPMSIVSTTSNCNSIAIELPEINVIECDTNVVVSNNSIYANQSGIDASGNYPEGIHTIVYTATDFCGNVGTCSFVVEVECANTPPPIPTAQIAGRAMTEEGLSVDMVDTQLSGDTSMAYMTNALGDFAFSGIHTNGTYKITPQKDNYDDNGVSTFDIVLIQQHILAINPLTSPYKIIAADVNNSGSVSTFDIVQIRQLVLSQITAFPNSNSWRFVAANHQFLDNTDPFISPFPEYIQVQNFVSDQMNRDFVAIKIGDVNGNASPNLLETPIEERNEASPLHIHLEDKTFAQDSIYTIPFTAKDFEAMIGFQVALQFDTEALELLDIEYGNLDGLNENNFGLGQLETGILAISWDNLSVTTLDDNDVIFSLIIKAKKTSSLQEVLQITERKMQAEAYTKVLVIKAIELVWQKTAIVNEVILHQNYPNPFAENTTIPFDLSAPAPVQFQFFDTKGELLYTYSAPFPTGKNELHLNRSLFPNVSGILFYQLCVGQEKSLVKKMVLEP